MGDGAGGEGVREGDRGDGDRSSNRFGLMHMERLLGASAVKGVLFPEPGAPPRGGEEGSEMAAGMNSRGKLPSGGLPDGCGLLASVCSPCE